MKGQYAAALNEHNLTFEAPPISAKTLANLLNKVQDNIISSNIAKSIFTMLWNGEDDVDEIIKREGYQQMDDSSALEEMIRTVIQQYPEQAAEYKAGKEKLLAFFVGQIMKQTKGQANPEQINTLLKKHLL